jgi:hypothetical protein
MKIYKVVLLAVTTLFLSCEDTVTDAGKVHEETKEEQIQEFITDAEEDHFNSVTNQDTVNVSGTPALLSGEIVYSLVFDGVNSGVVTLSFPDGSHERTVISDSPYNLTITETVADNATTVSPEDVVDLTDYNTTVVQQMEEFHLEPATQYTLTLSSVTVDTLRLFIAPRGLEETEDGHDH